MLFLFVEKGKRSNFVKGGQRAHQIKGRQTFLWCTPHTPHCSQLPLVSPRLIRCGPYSVIWMPRSRLLTPIPFLSGYFSLLCRLCCKGKGAFQSLYTFCTVLYCKGIFQSPSESIIQYWVCNTYIHI